MFKLIAQLFVICCLAMSFMACGETSGACSTASDCLGAEECVWVREGSQVKGKECSIRCKQNNECPTGTNCVGFASSCPTCNDSIQICQ